MLNRKTQFGLHALLHLGRHQDEFVGASKIADHIGSSLKYLEQILAELKQEGWISSKAGRDGGYQIAISTDRINLADLVRVLEGPIALVPCASHRFYEPCESCESPELCGAQDAFVQLRNDMVYSMKQVSIKDILERESRLKSGEQSIQKPTPYIAPEGTE